MNDRIAADFDRAVKLARRPAGSDSPPCPHCDSDATHTYKHIRPLHECLDCFEQFTTEEGEAAKDARLEPGQETSDGGHFEPDAEPDLTRYVVNKVGGGDLADGTSHATGFITSDGRGIQMGPANERYEDHRAAIPTSDAMRRWGWPTDIIKQYEEGTRTPALFELMRRAGLVRFHSDKTGTVTVSLAKKPTAAQIAAIENHLIRHRSQYAVISPRDGDEIELEGEKLWDVAKHLKKAARNLD